MRFHARQSPKSKCKRTRQVAEIVHLSTDDSASVNRWIVHLSTDDFRLSTDTHRKLLPENPIFWFLQTCQHLSTAASRLSTDRVLGRSNGRDMIYILVFPFSMTLYAWTPLYMDHMRLFSQQEATIPKTLSKGQDQGFLPAALLHLSAQNKEEQPSKRSWSRFVRGSSFSINWYLSRRSLKHIGTII